MKAAAFSENSDKWSMKPFPTNLKYKLYSCKLTKISYSSICEISIRNSSFRLYSNRSYHCDDNHNGKTSKSYDRLRSETSKRGTDRVTLDYWRCLGLSTRRVLWNSATSKHIRTFIETSSNLASSIFPANFAISKSISWRYDMAWFH